MIGVIILKLCVKCVEHWNPITGAQLDLYNWRPRVREKILLSSYHILDKKSYWVKSTKGMQYMNK